eukprot:72356-Pyramimonas_sp.AAC.1
MSLLLVGSLFVPERTPATSYYNAQRYTTPRRTPYSHSLQYANVNTISVEFVDELTHSVLM